MTRKSERVRKRPERFVDNGTKRNTVSEHETVVEGMPSTSVGSARGEGDSGRGRNARRRTRVNTSNSNQDTTAGATTAHEIQENEVDEIGQGATNNVMSTEDLRAVLDTTRGDITTLIRKVTGVLCALFSFLTPQQITEVETMYVNEIKGDEMFTKCVNQAKSSAKIRESNYRDALLKNENKRNNPINSENAETPQVIVQDGRNSETSTTIAQPPVAIAQNEDLPTNGQGMNQSGTLVNNAQRSTNGRTPSLPQPEWLQKLDENRKKNIILMGIRDTNNRADDEYIVNEVLKYIGCGHRSAQKTYASRLGARKPGRNRLLLVCFNNENAALQILNRSPRLHTSIVYGHIYIKKDLPRNQRPLFKKRNESELAEAANGGNVAPVQRPVLLSNVSSSSEDDELSDIESSSDFSDTDDDRAGDTDSSNDSDDDSFVTIEEVNGDEEDDSPSANVASSVNEATDAATIPAAGRFVSTANIVLSRPGEEGGDSDIVQRLQTLIHEVCEEVEGQDTPMANDGENNDRPAGNEEDQGKAIPD